MLRMLRLTRSFQKAWIPVPPNTVSKTSKLPKIFVRAALIR